MNIRFYVLCLLVLVHCSGCAAQKTRSHEPVIFASFEDFNLGPEGGVDLVWSTKRIFDAETLKTTLQKYDGLILGPTWIVVDKESFRNLDDKQILGLVRHMVKEIQTRLGHEFKLVETPDENTLRLHIAITNLETTQSILAMVNGLFPVGSGTSTVSKIVAGEPTKGGSITVELLVSDAKTNEPLLAAIDKKFSNKAIVTAIASLDNMKEASSLWADRLWITLSYWNWIKTPGTAP
jgi:hypothetical protein